jgi:hypothetical protein
MIQARKISTTTYPIVFFMADSADHVTGKTGLTLTVTLSKNGGSFGAASGAASEIGNGWYAIAGNATDRNTLGALAIHAAATGADPADVVVQVVNYDPYAIVGAVWDEVLTGATHNIATSAGRRLRTVDSNVILSDVLPNQTGVASNAIKFDGGASTVDGAYDPAIITILDGAGAGQTRLIYQYVGSTKTAYVDRDWKVQPTTGSTYAIIADAGREHINEGLAQGGGASTITLNALASSATDAYVGQIIFLRGGTGSDQASHVTAYNGTTKVATINKAWTVQPDNTTTYVMLPQGMLDLADLITSVWTHATRTLTGGGGASAADVWTYGTRTLTQSAVSPTTYLAAGTLVGLRGDTFSRAITGLGSLANYAEIAFTAKYDTSQPDSESVIKLTKKPGGSDGLIYLNGATTTAAWGSITIDDATDGDITIAISADAMKELSPNIIEYDVQIIRSSGTPVSTLAVGKWSITDDVTRNVV